jgi:multidrug efflux pump subunit AcrA (membrane-fusion protein)
MNKIGTRWIIVGGVIFGLAACDNQQPAGSLSPQEVTVSKPVQKDIVNWEEFTGRVAAVNLVKITPWVSGYIIDIRFNEGDIVHRGDLLFRDGGLIQQAGGPLAGRDFLERGEYTE